MTRFMALVAAAALVGASGPAAYAPRPSATAAATFKACRWGRVDGAHLSIWSFACRDQWLVPANDVGGFAVRGKFDYGVVIRSFTKAPDAPIDAILPAVLAASETSRRSCRLVPHARYGQWGAVWLLEPTGADKAAYDAANARAPQDEPCGRLSNGPVGERFFRAVPGDPGRIVFIDGGSEIQIFDPATIRPRR